MESKKLEKYIIFPIKYKAIRKKEEIECDNHSRMEIEDISSHSKYRIDKAIYGDIEEEGGEEHGSLWRELLEKVFWGKV